MKMRKNYFVKMLKYIKNVCSVEQSLSKLKDGRVNPTYKTDIVISLVLYGFMFRIQSFNELGNMIKNKEFNKLFPKSTKIPGIDTIRDTLKVIDLSSLRQMLDENIKKVIRNKVFVNGTIDGYTVAAMDGIKFFGSKIKSCLQCLVSGGHNYHSGVVMSTVGAGPKMVLGFEMFRPGIDSISKNKGELNAAKCLLSSMFEAHRKLIDVIAYDALACNSVFVNLCLSRGIDIVIRAKKNFNLSIRQVKKLVNKQEPIEVWKDVDGFERIDVYEAEFFMNDVEQPLRFVKFKLKRSSINRSETMIVTSLMDVGLKTLLKIARARWDIENSIFNNLKKECGLEHCFVHGGNSVEAVIYCLFIAANFMQMFFHRRLKEFVPTQRELVRLLLKGLYLLKYDKDLILSSA